MDEIAKSIREGIAWVVSNPLTWWVRAGSPDLRGEPAVERLQQWMLPITVAVAVLGLIAAGGRLALTRKATPLIDVGSGLLIIAATTALGVTLPSLLLRAGDAWSTWVLNQSTDDVEKHLSQLLMLEGAAPAVAVVLGIIAIIVAAVQALLMVFRQAAILVLAGLLPLAATGTLTPATKGWFRKVTAWMLTLIFYKPAAAAVYATAFTLIGKGQNPRTVFMGFAMVVLSILAFPALHKFFTWATGAADSSSSGNGLLGTVMGAAAAVGAMRGLGGGGGYGPVEQARYMNSGPGGPASLGPPPVSGPSGPGPHSSPPGDGGGSGRAPGPARTSSSGDSTDAPSGRQPAEPRPSSPDAAGSNPAGATGSSGRGDTGTPVSNDQQSAAGAAGQGASTAARAARAAGAASAVAGAVTAVRSVREGTERATGASAAPSGPGYDVRLAPGAASMPQDNRRAE